MSGVLDYAAFGSGWWMPNVCPSGIAGVEPAPIVGAAFGVACAAGRSHEVQEPVDPPVPGYSPEEGLTRRAVPFEDAK
jgi:hypothetical protein